MCQLMRLVFGILGAGCNNAGIFQSSCIENLLHIFAVNTGAALRHMPT